MQNEPWDVEDASYKKAMTLDEKCFRKKRMTNIHKAHIKEQMIKDGQKDVIIGIICKPPSDMSYMITTIDNNVTCKGCRTIIYHKQEEKK